MNKKILIVGYGKIGKRYLSILKKKKNIEPIIFTRNIIKTKKVKFINDYKELNKINGAIIATPVNTHFKYTKFFLEKNIPVLLEKPIASQLKQANELKILSQKRKTSLIINYSDLFDPNLIKLLRYISPELKYLKKIEMYYGNNRNKYYYKAASSPSEDWLPHPVSVLIFILNKIDNFKIIKYNFKINKKNGQLFEKFQIKFDLKKINILLNFSNFYKTNMRNISMETKNYRLNFDSYNKKNNFFLKKKIKKKVNLKDSSFENVTNIFLDTIEKKKFFSNIHLGLKEMKISANIIKEISLLRKNVK
tara:strand:- start:529 stop:1446 length:918 start_codon:yes stop_codon:yes gene_type:complete